MKEKPWVSFCISTFKRPEFIRKQISSLLQQTFQDFEIVISDNDPEASAREVALGFEDKRIKYFHNVENLGMIRSFNKSIDRAKGDFITMVTDDDPIERDFLSVMSGLNIQFPEFPLYAGFRRSRKAKDNVEQISAKGFISEILDPDKTTWMLWSSCIIKREAALKINKIPDYGSPHLADHAFLSMAGSIGGGVIINSAFSSLTAHDSNFSKFNFEYYIKGCSGFYMTMLDFCSMKSEARKNLRVVKKHLYVWFISCVFNLKRYYTVNKPDRVIIGQIDEFANTIRLFPFMKRSIGKYYFKEIMFRFKKITGILH